MSLLSWEAGIRLEVRQFSQLSSAGTYTNIGNRTVEAHRDILLSLLCGDYVQRLSPSWNLPWHGRPSRSRRLALAVHFLRCDLSSRRPLRVLCHTRQSVHHQSEMVKCGKAGSSQSSHGEARSTTSSPVVQGKAQVYLYTLACLYHDSCVDVRDPCPFV